MIKTQKMLISAALVCLLLLLVPSIPAVEYTSIEHTQHNQLLGRVTTLLTEKQTILEQLKESLAEQPFIDIALILVILNTLIVRMINKMSGQMPSTPLRNIMSFFIGISYYLMIIASEYQTGEIIMPRNSAYQLYFTTLFLIPITLLITTLPEGVVTTLLSIILGILSGILSSYLGDFLATSVEGSS